MASRLKDTLLLVTADHGMIDSEEHHIEDYPDIAECLLTFPNREPRSLSFFIKPGHQEKFLESWNKHFKEDFLLLTKAEVLEKQYFGSGIAHQRINDFIGDYVALAIGHKHLWFKKAGGSAHNHRAAHAGLCQAEMSVPLVLIET